MNKVLLILMVSFGLTLLSGQASARKGLDDGVAGNVRQCRGCDDPAGHVRQGRGQDDPAGHIRQGRGRDDAPGDVRQGRGQDHADGHISGRDR